MIKKESLMRIIEDMSEEHILWMLYARENDRSQAWGRVARELGYITENEFLVIGPDKNITKDLALELSDDYGIPIREYKQQLFLEISYESIVIYKEIMDRIFSL